MISDIQNITQEHLSPKNNYNLRKTNCRVDKPWSIGVTYYTEYFDYQLRRISPAVIKSWAKFFFLTTRLKRIHKWNYFYNCVAAL